MSILHKLQTLACFVVLPLALHPQQPGPVLTQQDIQAAGYAFQNYISPTLLIFKKTLHDDVLTLPLPSGTSRSRHLHLPDGNRGYTYIPDFTVGTEPYTGDPHHDSLVRLASEACTATAIVTARAGAASSYLVHDDQGIVTARTYHVTRVLSGTLTVGSDITVIGYGGTVRDDAGLLEVDVKGARPDLPGKQYLLFLDKQGGHPSGAYLTYDFWHDLVLSNRLFGSRRPGDEIIPAPHGVGESIPQFQNNITKAKSVRPCM